VPLLGLVKAVDNFDAAFQYIGTYPPGSDTHLYFSNKDAPKNKVISMQLPPAWKDGKATDPSREALDVAVSSALPVVPQSENTSVLESASPGGGASGWMLLRYSEDCKHKCYVASLASPGAARFEVPLPDAVSVYSFGASVPEDTEIFFQYTSFVTPAAIRRMDLTQLEVKVAEAEAEARGTIGLVEGVAPGEGPPGDSRFAL